jgi:hypothetical protein
VYVGGRDVWLHRRAVLRGRAGAGAGWRPQGGEAPLTKALPAAEAGKMRRCDAQSVQRGTAWRSAAQRGAAQRSAPSRGPCRPRGMRSAREGWGGSLAGQAGGCTQERERSLVWRGQQEQEGGRRPLTAAAQQSRRAGQTQGPGNHVHRSRTALAGACRSCTAPACCNSCNSSGLRATHQCTPRGRAGCAGMRPTAQTGRRWAGWRCAAGRRRVGRGRDQAWAKGRRPSSAQNSRQWGELAEQETGASHGCGLQALPPPDSPAPLARTENMKK